MKEKEELKVGDLVTYANSPVYTLGIIIRIKEMVVEQYFVKWFVWLSNTGNYHNFFKSELTKVE